MAHRDQPRSGRYSVLTIGTWNELRNAVLAILECDQDAYGMAMRAPVNRLGEAWLRVLEEMEGGDSWRD